MIKRAQTTAFGQSDTSPQREDSADDLRRAQTLTHETRPRGVSTVSVAERLSVQELPDLMDRIQQMGLSEEYLAYRERYLGWRQGKAQGAHGDLNAESLKDRFAAQGFGFWYPSVEEWQWRRTLSYWISVTFFEGSLFFTFSSFAWCKPAQLGHLKAAVTTWGYVAGKINFLICTYLMCIETINLTNAEHKDHSKAVSDMESNSSEVSSENSDAEPAPKRFKLWPFHIRTALRNLDEVGAGPWPYVASAVYLVGVLTFGVGLLADFLPLPEEVSHWTGLLTFLLGSIFFVVGGLAECIENGVFTSLKFDTGYVGAALNLIGGLGFLVGAIMGFWGESLAFQSMFAYGVGSTIFAGGSAVMIIMWKDEQFGLTFLAVLNGLGGPNGRPIVKSGDRSPEEMNTFSLRGALFIMVFCLTGCLSVYDFLIILADHHHNISQARVIERAFNSLLPCVFAHMMLALNAGVYKTPNIAPFHQLYILCRWIALFMVVNSGMRVYQELRDAAAEVFGQEPVGGYE